MSEHTPRMSFLGMGLIGRGLAVAAAARGHPVTLWNRSADKAADAAREIGAAAAVVEDPSTAVRGARSIHLALADDAAVDAVLDAMAAEVGDALVVDHSTVSPRGAAARHARMAARGVALVHAPVFMSPAMCRQQGGLMLLAGTDDDRARATPILAAMTGKLLDCGQTPDRAALLKLMGNAMIFAITAGLADVFAIAKANGLAPEEARALFDTFQPAGTLVVRGKKMAAGDFTPSFAMTMARKDAGLMLDAAKGGPTLHVLPIIAAWMDEVIARGDGALDVGALAKAAVDGA